MLLPLAHYYRLGYKGLLHLALEQHLQLTLYTSDNTDGSNQIQFESNKDNNQTAPILITHS